MDDTGRKQLQDIHTLQVKVAGEIGTIRGQLSNVVSATKQIAAEQAATRALWADHGKEIGRLCQASEDRLKYCGDRFETLGNELDDQRTCLRSLTEGTGKIKIEVIKQQAGAHARKKMFKFLCTVVGSVAAGGGLAFLFQLLAKC